MSLHVYKDRCQRLAEYIVENESTVRKAATFFGISKSTVHKDVSERLGNINPLLYEQVKIILDKNKSERHLRGGNATKEKYLKQHKREKEA